jgi:hypothetical protein
LFSAYKPSTGLNSGSNNQYLSETINFEDEDNHNNGNNNVPYLKYALIAGIIAVGSKIDEFGQCLFNLGPKVSHNANILKCLFCLEKSD